MWWTRQRHIELDSGRLAFAVHLPGEPDPKIWNVDLVTLRLAAETLEREHELDTVDGVIYGTPAFFEALCDRYLELGAPACDVSQARGIWIAVNQRFNAQESRLAAQIAKLG